MSRLDPGALSFEGPCTGTQKAHLSHALDHTEANTIKSSKLMVLTELFKACSVDKDFSKTIISLKLHKRK